MPKYTTGTNFRELKATKLIVENNLTPREAMRAVGYSQNYINQESHLFLRRENVRKAMEKAGLTDNYLSKSIKRIIKEGNKTIYNKVTPEVLTKNIELAFRLSGGLDKEDNTNNNTNIYIKEIKNLNDNDLTIRLNNIVKDIEALKG